MLIINPVLDNSDLSTFLNEENQDSSHDLENPISKQQTVNKSCNLKQSNNL